MLIFVYYCSFVVYLNNNNKIQMEYSLDDIFKNIFDREKAKEKRKTVVKTTKDGRRHWFPLELNGGLERRDVAWTYGERTVSGAFYYTNGRIGYDERQRRWKQIARDDKESFESNIPVVLFDKIKVISCVIMIENASRTLAATGAVGVQMRAKRGTNEHQTDVFLQEVSKCASPLGTIARYKLVDLSNLNHAHYHVNDEAYTININMPRGFLELAVILRSIAAWHRCKNHESRFVPHVAPEEENNNSITADSIISSVRNELTFKEKAVNSESFPLLTKAQFRTHKYIVRYTGKHTLSGNNPGVYPDVINAVNCTCTQCRNTKTCSNRKDTFHRHKGYTFCNDAEYRAQCLAPLKEKNEIQVHDRCFNCSAVSGIKLLPVICEMGGKLLQDKETALIDTTLVRTITLLEILANGLLPSHMSTFCEILCWQIKTRDMSLQQQMRVYKELEPLLSKIQISRQNYAQSGNFCQAMVRGHRLIKLDDRSIVSHKYKNEETVNIFKVRKRSIESDDACNNNRRSLGKHPRRSRGPVYMATCGLVKFGERMTLHGMEYPREDEM